MRLLVLALTLVASTIALTPAHAEDTCTAILCHEDSAREEGEGDCAYSTSRYERSDEDWVNATPAIIVHASRACGATSDGATAAERHSELGVDAIVFKQTASATHRGTTGYDEDGNVDDCETTLDQQSPAWSIHASLPCARGSFIPTTLFEILP